MSRIRVVLADDHPVIRAYIRRTLQREPDIVVVGEASDGLEVLKLVIDLEPDVVLLDFEMPGLNGIEAAIKIHDEGYAIPIVIISSHNDINLVAALFEYGVAGYVIKDEAQKEIVPAVQAVAQGDSGWVSQDMAQFLPEPAGKETNHPVTHLLAHGSKVGAVSVFSSAH
jgi:DNA-binding NarL/FixJ family response regulator